jgi:hypothetical protein
MKCTAHASGLYTFSVVGPAVFDAGSLDVKYLLANNEAKWDGRVGKQYYSGTFSFPTI